MPTRRALLLAPLPLLLSPTARAQADGQALLAAAQLMLGVERTAKLRLERGVLPTRAEHEGLKERQRIEAASRQLLDHPKALQALSSRRQSQVAATVQAASDFAAAPPASVAQLLAESEALASRLGFVTTALSGVATQPQQAAQLDLLTRAGASSLRVGKFNLAAASGRPAAELRVSARQAFAEFSAALQAVGAADLSPVQQRELQLVQHQWLLFSSALNPDGLAKDPQRLGEVASTTDRMAETLGSMARRALA